MTVRNNIPAMVIHGNLNAAGKKEANASERLSSGYRINRAGDDATGLAISEKMRGQIRGIRMAERNVEDGLNLLKTMDGGMAVIQDMMTRQRELMVYAANDTNEGQDREKIQLEIDQLTEEIGAVAERCEFNNIPLLTLREPERIVSGPSVASPSAPGSDGVLGDIADHVTGAADMLFVLDISVTMKPELEFMKNTVKDFMSKLSPGSRVSFVLYSDDENGSGQSSIEFNPTTDFDSALAFLDGIDVTPPNGDTPESGLSALDRAMNMPGFSGSALEKHIVFITDASSHTANDGDGLPDDGVSSFTISEINSRMKAEGIKFHGIGPTVDGVLGSISDRELAMKQIEALASGTGGSLSTIDDLLNGGGSSPDPSGPSGEPVFSGGGVREEGKYSPLWIQSGANGGQGMFVDRYDCRPGALYRGVFDPNTFTVEIGGVKREIRLSKLEVGSALEATASLMALDAAFGRVNSYRARAGAQYNRLEFTAQSLAISHENLSDAESRIRDADMAKEMMELTKSQTLRQVGVAMLAQANQTPETVLQLLG